MVQTSDGSRVNGNRCNTKKLVKKLAKIETSSICRQQFLNMFINCLSCEGRFTDQNSHNNLVPRQPRSQRFLKIAGNEVRFQGPPFLPPLGRRDTLGMRLLA